MSGLKLRLKSLPLGIDSSRQAAPRADAFGDLPDTVRRLGFSARANVGDVVDVDFQQTGLTVAGLPGFVELVTGITLSFSPASCEWPELNLLPTGQTVYVSQGAAQYAILRGWGVPA